MPATYQIATVWQPSTYQQKENLWQAHICVGNFEQ